MKKLLLIITMLTINAQNLNDFETSARKPRQYRMPREMEKVVIHLVDNIFDQCVQIASTNMPAAELEAMKLSNR